MDESFHSKYGAVAESYHIYITAGFNFISDERKEVNILEVGFGTGLNALLTYQESLSHNTVINYHAIEPYPLKSKIYSQLNYPDLIKNGHEIFKKFHQCDENQEITIVDGFNFIKSFEEIQEINLRDNFYDLVYFDAFNPDLEPEIWTEAVFKKIFKAMAADSVLVTYSTKGDVRRAMKSVGFIVEKLPGPKGKREICRAFK